MSPEDKRELQARSLLDYTESLQETRMLRDQISESGDFFIEVGNHLKNDPLMYVAKGYVFDTPKVDNLVQKWISAEEETERLKRKAIEYGNSIT